MTVTAPMPVERPWVPAPPKLSTTGVVGRLLTLPDVTGGRLAEGGLRLQGHYRSRRPGQPLVSIVTVCLNAERTLGQAIGSVLAQEYPNIEYIVVDGASRDGTPALLERHRESIDYYVSEPDGGLYQAMNKGLSVATGDLVLVLNADDWYRPDCVAALVAARAERGVDFVSARARYVDEQGRPMEPIRSMPFDAATCLRMPLRHETMLVPRALYDAVGGYDESYRIVGDFKLTRELFRRGYTHHEVPRVLMSFRNSGVSRTNLTKLTAERERLLAEQFSFLDAAELALLAEHGRLAADSLRALLERHGTQRELLAALHDFVRDQQQAGTPRWRDFDLSLLGAAAVTTAPDATVPSAKSPSPVAPTAPKAAVKSPALRVATLCSMDHGGAGTGTQRRVEALRKHGIEASIHSLVVKSRHAYVTRVKPQRAVVPRSDQDAVWQKVREVAIRPAREVPGYRAAELFSLPRSVVDFRDMKETFDAADVVHLHWVVGMFDYENAGSVLGDKPVVWTLADMNAFTGGCHYSEGCEGFKQECRACPLLGGESDLAHESWKRKQAAYAQIKNLHIVCPSKWIAERVSASSLLGQRPIHHIPNAFPVDRYTPTNRLVARIRLGLPLDKKLILFGADSLGNKRKGGDQLQAALSKLMKLRNCRDVEVILFGSHEAALPLRSRSLGYISDDRQLALVYSAADVFVSPSDEDSGPMTVGESMLCGTPVVAFQVGIAMEMIRHRETGFLAQRRDASELAQGLRWALDSNADEALQRSVRCHLFASRFHDPAKAVARHLKVYQEAMQHA